VNYGAGIAGAPLAAFIPATAIGLTVKAYVYARVARAVAEGGARELIRPDVWGLLLGLAALSLVAKLVAGRRSRPA
jgi:hypothetical protein